MTREKEMNTNKERLHRRPVDGDVRTQGVHSMSEVSTFRLYLLRAMYLFMAVGLAIFKLPGLLHPENLSPQDSVLGAFALLAVLGIRYPLKMLPLLFFEFVWKSIWVVAFGLPLLLSGGLDPNVSFGGTETLTNCLLGIVLVPLVMPWGYVLKHYLKAPGDKWGKQVTSSTPGDGDADIDEREGERQDEFIESITQPNRQVAGHHCDDRPLKAQGNVEKRRDTMNAPERKGTMNSPKRLARIAGFLYLLVELVEEVPWTRLDAADLDHLNIWQDKAEARQNARRLLEQYLAI